VNISVLILLFTKCVFLGWGPGIPPGRYHTTVATLTARITPINGSTYTVFEYAVGNKRYKTSAPSMPWVPIHEKYLLKYDTLHPENPESAEVIRECPVFLPGEVTNYTYGTLKKIHKSYELFDFEYTISGKKYERPQFLGIGNPVKNHPQLVNGAEFLVEYWTKNPERAILYIDKPKKDSMSFPVSPDIHVLRPVWDSIPVLLPNHK